MLSVAFPNVSSHSSGWFQCLGTVGCGVDRQLPLEAIGTWELPSIVAHGRKIQPG